MPLQELNKNFTPDKIGLRTPKLNPAISNQGVQTTNYQKQVEDEDRDLQTALSRPAYKPDIENNPNNGFGLSYDRPKKSQPSVYAAKKKVLEAAEENTPEYNMAEMIVDGLLNKVLGVKPYAYGMSQKEKDIQKRREGVNLELQKAHKGIIPYLLRAADSGSPDYAQLRPLQKAMNRNPTLFGKIGDFNETGTVPAFDPSTGEPNEFAGVPLYSLSYTDPNTGKTEQLENTSVPELLEAYYNNLPEPDSKHLLRAAIRKQYEDKLKRFHDAKGYMDITYIGTDKKTGKPLYRYVTRGGEINYGSGEQDEAGNNVWTPSEQINFAKKDNSGARRIRLATDKFNREGTYTTPKQKADLNVRVYNLGREIAGTDDMGNQNPVTPFHTAKALSIIHGGKIVRGKDGTPQAGKFMVVKNGKPIDQYGNPLKAVIRGKAKAGLQRRAETKKIVTGLPKKKSVLQKTVKTAQGKKVRRKKTFGRTKLIDPDKPFLVDTKDITSAAKEVYSAGKKTGDYVGALEKYLLRLNKQAGDAIFNQIVKAARAIAASQAKARRQSFGN
jgi:hypothetical protein